MEPTTCSECYELGGSCGKHPQPVRLCTKHASVEALRIAVQEMRHYIKGNAPESAIKTRLLSLSDAALRQYEGKIK